MWSTDYPHSDSMWPKSREALAEPFRDVPADERALIAGAMPRVSTASDSTRAVMRTVAGVRVEYALG